MQGRKVVPMKREGEHHKMEKGGGSARILLRREISERGSSQGDYDMLDNRDAELIRWESGVRSMRNDRICP